MNLLRHHTWPLAHGAQARPEPRGRMLPERPCSATPLYRAGVTPVFFFPQRITGDLGFCSELCERTIFRKSPGGDWVLWDYG